MRFRKKNKSLRIGVEILTRTIMNQGEEIEKLKGQVNLWQAGLDQFGNDCLAEKQRVWRNEEKRLKRELKATSEELEQRVQNAVALQADNKALQDQLIRQYKQISRLKNRANSAEQKVADLQEQLIRTRSMMQC